MTRGPQGQPQAGFTLLELAITVAVLAVVLAVGIPSFQGMINRNRLSSITNEIVGATQLARMEAIRRNTRVVVCPTTNGSTCNGANWMRVVVRESATGGAVIREFQFNGQGITVQGSPSIATGNQLSFNASGFARAGTNAANTSGAIRICTSALAASENARDVQVAVSRISVTPTGSAGCGQPANA
ncbi:MAG TPA: GspH/FimT family pseudopilin [Arenimonas sp.]|uniref:GspH/FimT family pseudopilin n=1 Tax=Arenimonas sp. TaxID=1872635 RepID=UPI002D7FB06D|nr:GspH/FimT family pseudopilin [Arenimonas sp.]HEU0153020.1 GspH/FimT family pseudopilin [Arenimonas sp.]